MAFNSFLTLTSKQCPLFNCFGIQPIFVDNNYIPKSFLGFAYRVNNNKGGTMKYDILYRKGQQNEVILKNSFHIKDGCYNVIKTIRNNSFSFKHNGSLDDLMKNRKLLKQTLLYYMERIHYYVTVGKGNFIITSRKDLYNTQIFTSVQVRDFEIYLVGEDLLPRNMIILGHKNYSVYGSPYVACPLINKQHFDQLLQLNNINQSDFKIDTSLQYPMYSHYQDLYYLYQSYLDNVDIPYWYIETFNNPTTSRQKAYYITLLFD